MRPSGKLLKTRNAPISPFLIHYHKTIAVYFSRLFALGLTESVQDHSWVTKKRGHVVICGYEKIGVYLTSVLSKRWVSS